MLADQTHPEAALDARSLVQELTGVQYDPVDVAQLPVGVLFADGWEFAGGHQDTGNPQDSEIEDMPKCSTTRRTV